MKTFNELCTMAHDISGMQGSFTDVSAPGLSERLSKAISNAWVMLQEDNSKDFTFMEDVINFEVPLARVEFTPEEYMGVEVATFGAIDAVLFNKRPIQYTDQLDFKLRMVDIAAGSPSLWSINATNDNLFLNPNDTTEAVQIKFTRSTQILVEGIDVLRLGRKGCMAVVSLGLLNFSYDIGNGNLQAKASKLNRDAMGALCRQYNKAKRMTTRYNFVI